MKVNYNVLSNSIVLNFNGKTMIIDASDKRYNKVITLIQDGNEDLIPSVVELEFAFEGTRLSLVDGQVMIDGERLPDALSSKILMLQDKELTFDPLVNFWDKLKMNPSFNSRLQLFKFLEHNKHPLTKDGKFIAYRGVSSDLKDLHTGKFDNSVGSVCEMPRESVDDNPNNTCSNGLHVAAFEYAKGFGSRLVEVEVCPSDVVTVPTDYNGTKMRVCKFKVVALGTVELDDGVYGEDDEETDGFNFGETDMESENELIEAIERKQDELYEIIGSISSVDLMSADIDMIVELKNALYLLEDELQSLQDELDQL